MSCFKIPDSHFDELTSMIRNFWWGQKQDERKMTCVRAQWLLDGPGLEFDSQFTCISGLSVSY